MTARLLLAFIPAAGVVLTLFWVMNFLIVTEEHHLPKEVQKYLSLDFTHQTPTPLPTSREHRKPKKQRISQNTPKLPPLTPTRSPTTEEMEIKVPTFQHTLLQHDAAFHPNADSDYFPILKVAPEYPPRALSRGIEGSCMVAYTVTDSGTVENVRVLENRCDSKLFHAASRRAAKKFRYRPRMLDGRPVGVSGVKNNFVFQITEH